MYLYIKATGYLDLEQPSACVGGLKASMRVGSLIVEGSAPVNDRVRLYGDRPGDAPSGTPATVEAWCYGEGGTELGYARVDRNLHAGAIPTVDVVPAAEDAAYQGCLQTSEGRGLILCIASDLLE